jgi:hypothetical protein
VDTEALAAARVRSNASLAGVLTSLWGACWLVMAVVQSPPMLPEYDTTLMLALFLLFVPLVGLTIAVVVAWVVLLRSATLSGARRTILGLAVSLTVVAPIAHHTWASDPFRLIERSWFARHHGFVLATFEVGIAIVLVAASRRIVRTPYAVTVP